MSDVTSEPIPTSEPLEAEVDRLLAEGESTYVDEVMALYESSERKYRAAMAAGEIVHGLSDSTNF